jgi:cell division protein ZapE
MTSLLTHFDALVTEGRIHADPMQRQVMLAFDAVVSSCIKNKHWLFPNRNKGVTGLYLYGEVGVGKTFLMDLFYHEVPIRKKKRYHLYPFMQQIDSQLRRLQGHADPLKRIAKDLSKTTQLLCFDEFMVHDVATAMMLAELLHYLFEYGVVLVATSNIKPDDLYLNGLQRARFLPAIALIKTHCRVMQMPSIHDYRLDHTTSNVAYYFKIFSILCRRGE